MKKRTILSVSAVFLICSIAGAQPEPIKGSSLSSPLKVAGTGNKTPENTGGIFSIFGIDVDRCMDFSDSFNVSINYTDYFFVTGQGLAGYYIGLPMRCEVVITNAGYRDYYDLTVTMIHEYFDSGTCDRWWKEPSPVHFEKGEQLPGSSAMIWPGLDIKRGETLVLPFSYVPPLETCAGLDQTHVVIQSPLEETGDNDRVIELYNNSEAGVFCPPPPE